MILRYCLPHSQGKPDFHSCYIWYLPLVKWICIKTFHTYVEQWILQKKFKQTDFNGDKFHTRFFIFTNISLVFLVLLSACRDNNVIHHKSLPKCRKSVICQLCWNQAIYKIKGKCLQSVLAWITDGLVWFKVNNISK